MDRQVGFTLIEIVFVIGVLGVLATFAVQGLGGSEKITDLIQAEDRVIAELRRARAQVIHQLPPASSGAVATAAIADSAGPSVAVCPKTVDYNFDPGATGGIDAAHCSGCAPCDTSDPYDITLTSSDGSTRGICLIGETGRVERSPCDG